MLPHSGWPSVALALSTFIALAYSADSSDWRTRSIYQLVTDRFARTDNSTTAVCPPGFQGFCGGTWQGIIQQLDYIQGMGFDAIWISPVTKQIDDPARSYHGYSQQDLYQVNQNMGTPQDLKDLAAALHGRDMYLMIDLVTNHFGAIGNASLIDYSTTNPFNKQSQFHDICFITYDTPATSEALVDCWIGDASDPLPDVYTALPSVRAEYNSWIGELVSNYSVDGLRIDSVKNVEQSFWPGFQTAAGVYIVGEVSDGDVGFACPFQQSIDGFLNYPMYYQLTPFFSSSSTSPQNLINEMKYLQQICKDPTLLGPFAENHDQARFPSLTPDMSLAKNVIAFTMFSDGIPIIYSGQEQHLNGTAGFNREAIWLTGYDTSSVLYQFIIQLNQLRKQAIAKSASWVLYESDIIYSDNHNIVLQKGNGATNIVGVYSNVGASASTYTLNLANTGFAAGSTVMEVLSCTQVTVGSNGILKATVTTGLPLVFFPILSVPGSPICKSSHTKRRSLDR
ncbi:hypothetical protein MMC12_006749 [Toensbergia leucococca]|nr:hypothetical protein [Toensbergia leucococca]